MTKKYFAFLVLTVVGGLLFALGMCVSCCLVWTDSVFALGAIVGVIGMAVLSLAYPMYNRAIKMK